MKKNISVLLIVFLIMVTPIFAYAHVKWFTTVPPEKETIEHILSPFFLFVAISVAVLLSVLPQILPLIMKWSLASKIDKKLDELRKYSRLILKYGTAISLIVQVINGTLFAPEFHIDSNSILLLSWISIVLLLVPHHFFTKASAILIIFLFGSYTLENGIFHMLDYGFYLSIAGVLLLEKTRLSEWSFPFLYLGTGLSLCWVAVEKWVYPDMTIDIVLHHHIPTFGFSSGTFIILSAFIEFVVGYLLVVGILNRLLAVVLTGIFILTTMVFGWVEVVGHLMIHFLLIIFIIEGVSFYHPPVKMHNNKMDQMIFVFLNFLFVLATYVLIYYRFGK